MSVSLVERDQATPETLAFHDKAEERFEMPLNIFKVFGHVPKHGAAFTDPIMEILQDGEIDWLTKELLILKATHRNDRQYCVVRHETLSKRMGISDEKIADIGGDKYKTSPYFTEPQIVEAVYVITIYIAVGKFGDALGVALEPVFSEIEPILKVHHHEVHH
ncbi:MAG: carboxymuconolactone decarboxylase family protein [Alphaproteobacteria bacterium]